MGYRSQVRSMIYGDPDILQALITKHVLTGSKLFDEFEGGLRRVRLTRTYYDAETTTLQERIIEALDLHGDGWKWYEGYEDVRAWHELLLEAQEAGLCTEFVRAGEEAGDIETDYSVEDGGDFYLGVSVSLTTELEGVEAGGEFGGLIEVGLTG